MGWLTSALGLANDHRPLNYICNTVGTFPAAGKENGRSCLCPVPGFQATIYRVRYGLLILDRHAEPLSMYSLAC
jgi:hypothetical protein